MKKFLFALFCCLVLITVVSCTQKDEDSMKVSFSVIVDGSQPYVCVVPEGTTYRDLNGLSVDNSNDGAHDFKVEGNCLKLSWQEAGSKDVFIDETLSISIGETELDSQIPDGITLYVSTMPA